MTKRGVVAWFAAVLVLGCSAHHSKLDTMSGSPHEHGGGAAGDSRMGRDDAGMDRGPGATGHGNAAGSGGALGSGGNDSGGGGHGSGSGGSRGGASGGGGSTASGSGGSAAGGSGGADAGPPCTPGTMTRIPVTNIDKVDMLFMVDNSNSMREEQAALRTQFAQLIEVLTTGDRDGDGVNDFPPAKDLHLGVVSSDMGLLGVDGVDDCSGLGDDGILQHAPSTDPALTVARRAIRRS